MFSKGSRVWLFGFGALVALALGYAPAVAGTTGVVSGVTKNEQGVPVADARVTAASPSQSASASTNASGFFSMLNLSPDTYTVTVSKQSYETANIRGVTVQADQVTHVDVLLHPAIRTIGRVTTTAVGGLVSKTVTGDLYTVSEQAINRYQGSAGGAETLYSQNGVVGSLPGVTRSVGTGGGYAGNGSLSFRGGSNDQIGFELEGIPLNRAFDSANATAFLTNGLSSLEVYTGGEPANAGRSMSGYINEIIRRGSYPGGGDLTYVIGSPLLTNTIQADIYGGTPDRKFTYYVSTLWVQADYNFGDRSNLDNVGISVPASDVGCGAANGQINASGGTTFNMCGTPLSYNIPISQAAWSSFLNPNAKMADTVINLNWSIDHQGLSDNLQALYTVGMTQNPFLYSGPFVDTSTVANCSFPGATAPLLVNACPASVGQPMTWPYGRIYTGQVGQGFNPMNLYTLTWPSAGGSIGDMPSNYLDTQRTQSSIEKLSYTRALTSASFIRLYGYSVYSLWNFDQATNAWLGDSFYDLHENASGLTLNYQNQLNQQHLLRVDVDYLQEKVLRYNYAPNFPYGPGSFVNCFPSLVVDYTATLDTGCSGAQGGTPEAVAQINGPYAYWNNISPVSSDVALADTWRPSDRLTFDVGVRYDRFQIPLMPLQVTGPNGVAEIAQNQFGTCLDGYAYAVGENCNTYLNVLITGSPTGCALLTPPDPRCPGMANWANVSGSVSFNFFSPRFGITYAVGSKDVLRFAVGRYVQPPATYGYEYTAAPQWGASDTVAVLNNFYDSLGFLAVHNIQPQDSTNFDFSWEHDFGRGISMKLSPYYRNTRNQILSIPVNPLQPTFVTGYNFGAARIDGVEFLLRSSHQGDGWNGALAATYTNSLIRFQSPLGGKNFLDTINSQITAYNSAWGTTYPLFDRNAYYKPSLVLSPGGIGPSYDVAWVLNLNTTYTTHGWDFSPTFNYQSGNAYGDPLLFPDPHCPSATTTYPGCIPNPGNVALVSFGPDPYTKQFDGLGSFKGPWWLTMNFGVSHDIARNVKASILLTNVFTVVHNQGYPWEFPTSKQVLAYGDNTFYSGTQFAAFNPVYLGESYYPYSPSSINPYHQVVFSVSTKI
jgi:hypothetical protein